MVEHTCNVHTQETESRVLEGKGIYTLKASLGYKDPVSNNQEGLEWCPSGLQRHLCRIQV